MLKITVMIFMIVQAENALHSHGFPDGLPYWDWTLPMNSLPDILSGENYMDPKTGISKHNPLFNGPIDASTSTVRKVNSDLFEQPAFGNLTRIADQVCQDFIEISL